MTYLEFKCPQCGDYRLEENVEDCFVSSQVEVRSDGSIDGVGHPDIQDGNLISYGCFMCNYIIMDKSGEPITDGEELAEWLKENC